MPWLNWNVYINPETEKVDMVYLVKKINDSVIQQLTWKASKGYCKIISINTPNALIDELVDSGFEKEKEVKKANLEDVFIHMTGKALREA